MHFERALFCVSPASTIREAAARIDGNAAKIALMIDDDGCLLDTITDGDIRRAILSGLDLSSPLDRLPECKLKAHAPVTAPIGTDAAILEHLMRERRVRQIPLLDARSRVVGIVTLKELAGKHVLPMHAVIMAGGYGMRLRPLTENMPKPMLPVGDRPLLELIIERLHEAGIRRVSLLTHYKAEAIESHFGGGENFGVEIDYVQEDEPHGTAGAL